MKKQNAYTIKDKIFLDALKIIHENFYEVPYAIVGGGAVQIYAAYTTMKAANLNSVNEINGLSLFLRKTGDIDLSFHFDPVEITKKFNVIIEQATGKYVFHSFSKRFVIQSRDQRFNLNYQLDASDLKGIPEYYQDIIDSALSIDFPHDGGMLNIKIAKPEYLVISKLIRIKPKDQMDIVLLLKAVEMNNYLFDTEEVRSVLKSVDKLDNYNILIELMDSV